MAEPQEIDAGLAALLRGDAAHAASLVADGAPPASEIARRADYHGISHLLVTLAEGQASLPKPLADILRDTAMAREFWEASHMRAVQPALDALVQAGVTPIVMKGTALAYSLYASPAARTRGDTDVLVTPADLPCAREVLQDAGFMRGNDAHGTLFQESWRTPPGQDLVQVIDLHWQLNDSPVLQQALPLEGALARTRSLPRLGDGVRALSYGDSLLQQAFNAKWHSDFGFFLGQERVTGMRRLIWAYDTHLLLHAMDAEELESLVQRAMDAGAAPALLEAIEHARAAIGSAVEENLLVRLRGAPSDTPVMRYLRTGDLIARRKADLRATRGLRAKARFVAGLLHPPPHHLRKRFPRAQAWPLPLLYLRYAAASAMRAISARG